MGFRLLYEATEGGERGVQNKLPTLEDTEKSNNGGRLSMVPSNVLGEKEDTCHLWSAVTLIVVYWDVSKKRLLDVLRFLMPKGTVLFSIRAIIGYVTIARNESIYFLFLGAGHATHS